jgi:hypothetical protein
VRPARGAPGRAGQRPRGRGAGAGGRWRRYEFLYSHSERPAVNSQFSTPSSPNGGFDFGGGRRHGGGGGSYGRRQLGVAEEVLPVNKEGKGETAGAVRNWGEGGPSGGGRRQLYGGQVPDDRDMSSDPCYGLWCDECARTRGCGWRSWSWGVPAPGICNSNIPTDPTGDSRGTRTVCSNRIACSPFAGGPALSSAAAQSARPPTRTAAARRRGTTRSARSRHRCTARRNTILLFVWRVAWRVAWLARLN